MEQGQPGAGDPVRERWNGCQAAPGQFKSSGQVQRFLSGHNQINNLFHLRRDHVTAAEQSAARTQTLRAWVRSPQGSGYDVNRQLAFSSHLVTMSEQVDGAIPTHSPTGSTSQPMQRAATSTPNSTQCRVVADRGPLRCAEALPAAVERNLLVEGT